MSYENCNLTRHLLPRYLGIDPGAFEQVLSDPGAFYHEGFSIEVKAKKRIIHPPLSPLKEIQRILLRRIYNQVCWLPCLHGWIPGNSIITNARPHIGKDLILTYDISDFFPSTTDKMVRDCFQSLGFGWDASDALTKIVTLNGSLPQGAPTSPAIANLVFKPSDVPLIKLCRKHGLTYTRYGDDITISGDKDFRYLTQAILGNIERQGFKVNPKKIKHMFSHERQIVTGLVVNHKLSPTNEFIKETKTLIRRSRQEGPDSIADEYGWTVMQLRQKITGRITFVRSIYPKKGRLLRGQLVGIHWH